jgi:predicted RNase H-like HicB family nuclease
MTLYFPVVIERETNGTFSAWVAGLPGVYAAADTAAVAKRALLRAVAAHLDALSRLGRSPQPKADLAVLRYESGADPTRAHLRFTGLGVLLGRATSRAKAEASRQNAHKSGRRPRTVSRAASGRRRSRARGSRFRSDR